MSLTRSLICHDRDSFDALSGSFPVSRLVKVLDMWTDRVYGHFPTEILQLVYLRYLCLCCDSELPLLEISQELRNLQTLIVVTSDYLSRGGLFEYESPHTIDSQIVEIPVEVWEMPQLRCIKFCSGVIRYNGYRRLTSVREKMQTISNIQLHKLQQCHFFTTFPNMRSLKLNSYSLHRDRAVHLEHMHKLEKLRCSSFRPLSNQFLSSLRLPSSLRKLTLNQCAVPVEFMASLCRLPNLQILRIGNCDFTNEDETTAQEWEVGDGDEFRSLQFLHLENSNLVRWTADETSFPRLRHLLLKFCYDLLEIPGSIGEITTMKLIELVGCGDSVVESARRIVEEQQSEYDNYDLQIRISS